MKHTNILLKNIEHVEEEVRDPKILNDLHTKLRAIHDLVKTPGWQFFVEELKTERRKILALIERANDPTSLAKLTGTLLSVESFVEWPVYVSQEIEAQAKDLEND